MSKITQVKFTNADYSDMVPRYKRALEDGAFTLPKDSDILGDHRLVRVIGGIPKLPETSRYKEEGTGKKRHGDSFIALVLGLAAACQHPAIERWQSKMVPQQNSRETMREGFGSIAVGRGLVRGLFS
jgi:phage FluMu gp28-like protein